MWLIRHAISQSNAGLATRDAISNGLTPEGIDQAHRIADALDGPLETIVVTPFARSIETAQPLIEKNPGADVKTLPLQEFTYLDPDRCRDTTRAERSAWKQSYWERADPLYFDGDAESFSQFLSRVETGIHQLKLEPENTAVITHGHVLRVALLHILKGRLARTPEAMLSYYHLRQGLRFPNGVIIEMDFNERRVSGFHTEHLNTAG